MDIAEKLLIEVFYLAGGETPFICGVNGKATTQCLCEIESDLIGDDPYNFDKGEGSYFFNVYHEPTQYGFEGRIEIESYYDFTFVRHEPLANK